jgi:hypothetical protein
MFLENVTERGFAATGSRHRVRRPISSKANI